MRTCSGVIFFTWLLSGVIQADDSKCLDSKCSWRPINPVCGSDGELYYNACHLKYTNCMNPSFNLKAAKFVSCYKHFCLRLCSRELDWICGSDKELQSNPCVFLEHVCTVKKPIYEIDMEPCLEKKCPQKCSKSDKNCLKERNNCRMSWGGDR